MSRKIAAPCDGQGPDQTLPNCGPDSRDAKPPPQVLYLAHDLDDAAIWRRVAMLRQGGADVHLAGFRRRLGALPQGLPGRGAGRVQDLGRTANGRMAARAISVLRVALATLLHLPGGVRLPPVRPDAILARNLEMLVLAAVIARRLDGVPVTFELLDIHRMMLGPGRRARLLRHLEGALLRRATLVLLSSPGFISRYLVPYDIPVPALRLVENKPLAFALPAPEQIPARRDGPIVIGWFGILRCAWSLQSLDALTRAAPGRYRVDLRGRPALDVLPRFHATVAANPDLQFHGAYDWPGDLAAIYAGVDLAWMIDRYDAGGNSDWLLPNRLYEGCLHGAVPLGLAGTQVGFSLKGRGIGLVLPLASRAAAMDLLAGLDAASLTALKAQVQARPRDDWLASDAECRLLVADMCVPPPVAPIARPARIGAAETNRS